MELLLKDIPANHPLRAGIAAFRGELLRAPWNITGCFLAAIDGKVVMRLQGPGDPSRGRGHAFSYVKRESKRGGSQSDTRLLRSLNSEQLCDWLVDHRVPLKRAESLSRNERIALARQIIADDYNVMVALTKFVKAGNKYTPEAEADAVTIKNGFQKQIEVLSREELPDDELSEDYTSDYDERVAAKDGAADEEDDELTAYGRDLEAELLGHSNESKRSNEGKTSTTSSESQCK